MNKANITLTLPPPSPDIYDNKHIRNNDKKNVKVNSKALTQKEIATVSLGHDRG